MFLFESDKLSFKKENHCNTPEIVFPLATLSQRTLAEKASLSTKEYNSTRGDTLVTFNSAQCDISPDRKSSEGQKEGDFTFKQTVSNKVFQVAPVVKNPPANAGRPKRPGFDPWVGKIPWRRKWQPTPVFLPGKSHGQRSLMGCSPYCHTGYQTWLKQLSTYDPLSREGRTVWMPNCLTPNLILPLAWGDCFTSLCLSFITCEMGIMTCFMHQL